MSLIDGCSVYQKTLSCGRIEVSSEVSDYPLTDLFDIAERRNPKRAFLFVSKVLGRHIPVSPQVMRDVYTELAEQFLETLDGPVVFIGMAETAVGLGAGVFDEVRKHHPDCVYLTSTRHPVDGELLCEFKEEHSHATDHLIYYPSTPDMRRTVAEAQTLVLVDDEATTGKTFLNLLASLRASGALKQVQRVIAVTLTDWSGEALSKHCPLPVHAVSLISGHWRWTPDPDAPLPVMPPVNVTSRGNVPVTGKQSWGDSGCRYRPVIWAFRLRFRTEKTFWCWALANSSGNRSCWQNGWKLQALRPFYSSTTRSPISTGFAIQSAIAFSDNYGLGIPNFVYNVAHQQFDRILLCTETPASSVDPHLLEALSAVAPDVEVITYE